MERYHIESSHSLRHFRECLWLPSIVERAGWDGPEMDARALARVVTKTNDLLAQYRKPESR